jgi:hypothetical protein
MPSNKKEEEGIISIKTCKAVFCPSAYKGYCIDQQITCLTIVSVS